MEYISVLRGINVGGKRILPMKNLISEMEKAGFSDIRTYIQSGNVIFKSDLNDYEVISQEIEHLIKSKFGFDVPVITLSGKELHDIIVNNPFLANGSYEIRELYVTLLNGQPAISDIEQFYMNNFGADSAVVIKKVVYLRIPGLSHQSKLTNNFIESKLKMKATTRNWKTILKISNMMLNK